MSFRQIIYPRIATAHGDMEVRLNVLAWQPQRGIMRGAWNSTATYAINDVVYYNDLTSGYKLFRAASINTNVTPGVNATWGPATNTKWIQDSQADVLYLDREFSPFTAESFESFKKSVSREEGQLTPDTRGITLLDFPGYSGVDGNGTVVAYNDLTASDVQTFNNLTLLSDPDGIAMFQWGKVGQALQGVWNGATTYNQGDTVSFGGDTWRAMRSSTAVYPLVEGADWIRDRELSGVGFAKASNISSKHLYVQNERSVNENLAQVTRVTVDAIQNLLAEFKVRDLIPFFGTVDFVTNVDSLTYRMPFYAGYVIREGKEILSEKEKTFWVFADTMGIDDDPQWRATPATIGTNNNLHLVRYSTILTKMLSELCGFTFGLANKGNAGNDAETELDFYTDATDQSSAPYNAIVNTTRIASSNYFIDLGVCYEGYFGVDPRCDLNVSEIRSPNSHGWDTPLSTVFAKICDQFLCYPRMEYDQTNMRPRLRLRDIRKDYGDDLPSNWVLTEESSTTQPFVSAQHIETKNTYDDDVVCSPHTRGKALTKEIQHGAKPIAAARYGPSDFTYDSNIEQPNQFSTWQFFTGGLRGVHIVSVANITHVSGSLYQVYSQDSDFSQLHIGDPIHFVGLGAGISTVTVNNLIDHNTIYVFDSNGTPVTPVGSNIQFCIGYDGMMTDLVVTDGSTDISSASFDFSANIGKWITIPKRGRYIIKSLVAANIHNARLDRLVEVSGTGLIARVGGPDINPDGWHVFSLMYYYGDNTTRRYHPYYYDATRRNFNEFSTTVRFSAIGAYSVTACKYQGGTAAPGATFGNTLATHAQVFAAQTIGTRTQITRLYRKCLGNDGKLNSYGVGSGFSTRINGSYKRYTSGTLEIHELDPKSGWVRVIATESSNTSTPIDEQHFPIVVSGAGASSGSASSIGSGSGGGTNGGGSPGGSTSIGATVILAPPTIHRNRIQATTTGIVPLETQLFTGSTDDHFVSYDADGTTIRFRINYQGNVTGAAFTGTTITLSGKGTSAATVGGDGSTTLTTKGYVDTLVGSIPVVTNYVKTDPSTAQQIRPTANVIPLDVRLTAGGSTNIMTWGDSGAVLGWFDSLGKVHSPATAAGDTSSTLATKGWTVCRFPDTANSNSVQPQDSSTPALVLKSFGSGTADMFAVTDSSNNYWFKVDFTGKGSFSKGAALTNASGSTVLSATTVGDAVMFSGTATATSANILQITDGTSFRFILTWDFKLKINGGGSASHLDVNGSFGTQAVTKTASYTLTANDHTVWADSTGGAFPIILPTASGCAGREYCIKRINAGANNVTVAGTIDGVVNKLLTAQYQSVRVKSNGTNWYFV